MPGAAFANAARTPSSSTPANSAPSSTASTATLTDADLQKIVTTYHTWRGEKGAGKYEDLAGFCKSATTAEIAAHDHVLTPGRYVGAEEVEDDGESFSEKMPRLVAELHAQFAESAKLEQAINANLRGLGYDGR